MRSFVTHADRAPGVMRRNTVTSPFHLGQPFEVMILIEEQHYKIAINGSHFCEYRHRIPKDTVRQLTVEGDVQLSQIRFQGGSYPAGHMGHQPHGHHGHHHHHHGHPPGHMHHPPPPVVPPPMPSSPYAPVPIYNPPMPVNLNIPGGMQPGKMIRISGQSGYNPSRFNVNLVNGRGFHSNADIGMHCDVRFNYGDNRNVVVRTQDKMVDGDRKRDTPPSSLLYLDSHGR